MSGFVHLHVHTEYSLLDGAARINELLDVAKKFGMTSLAITDHGTMYGIINFYKAAIERGIKPIIGCEVYVALEACSRRPPVNGAKYFHLVLLAENNTGYKNLIKLATIAYSEGFYYRPRVDKEKLRQYHEGLIALSACVVGEIPRAILNNDLSRAKEVIAEYVDIFGRENFFLEIQNHGLDEEAKVRSVLKKLSAELNIPLVATNDVHYIRREDAEFHDLFLCIKTGKTINEKHRLKFPSDDYYLKTEEEMRELFRDTPEACDNTVKIAERCNVSLEFGKFLLPEFPLPEGFTDAADYLRGLCYKKVHERYEVLTDEVKSRLEYELEMINNMGYNEYFLMVWDFINFAQQKKIPVGPGRGSAAGSIIAYILGITEIDPLKYNLLFERFLNPARVTYPDIDIDLCYYRRKEVIQYARELYGKNKVSQIVTFGTLAAKAAIRDVARVLEVSYSESSRIVKMIPDVLNITIDEALKKSNEMRAEYETNPDSKKIIDFARKLEGLPRNFSIHGAGIVISKVPLYEIVPLQFSSKMLDKPYYENEQYDSSKNLVYNLSYIFLTQYDKDAIEEIGLLKMDFLGLRTLTIIAKTLDNIKRTYGVELNIYKIPLRDRKTAAMLSAGETDAVFQMESEGMTALVQDLRPEGFEDLIPTIALYRPGPLGSGMVEDFIAGKHGRKVAHYLHPKLEPILKETFGVILYQEQVMQIVQTLAGFTLGQADILRRAMGKKKADILLAQKKNFLQGCEANGVEKSLAEKIFELLTHFADYGFNKSHSAAYGLLAWQTAYLKANYTAEYMAAVMSDTNDIDKLSAYIELSRRLGIKILAPDINLSEGNFTVDNGAIRFGLLTIKTVNEKAVENIITERKMGKFTSLEEFCTRLNLDQVPKRSLINLIKCGAFDSLDKRRTALLNSLDLIIAASFNRRKELQNNAINLFRSADLSKIRFHIPDIKERPLKEILAWEKEILGFYISGTPLEEYRETFSRLNNSKNLEKSVGKRVKVGGIITDVRQSITKKGDMMARVKLNDFFGVINVILFSDVFNQYHNVAFFDNIVVVEGRVDGSNASIQLLAESIVSAESYMPDFWLTIPAQLEDSATFDSLGEIFDEHKGSGQVFINRSGKWRKIGKKISDSQNLRKALKNLLGAENVRLY